MRLRIALVANTDWYLYNYRLSLAREILAAGGEAILISPSGAYVPRIREEGFLWLRIGLRRLSVNPFRESHALLGLVRLYLRHKPDLVHHFTHKPVIYGSLAARIAGGIPVVNSVTGLGYLFTHPGWRAVGLRRLALPAFRIALAAPKMRVIFQNTGDKNVFVRSGLVQSAKCAIIPGSGVDPDRFRPWPEPAGDPIVLMSSRMLWDKGVADLVDAARKLRTEKAKFRLILAGAIDVGNPTAIPQQQLHAWEDEGVLEWIGQQDDMPSLLARSHIVVLPSYGEGIPRALVEAASCAKPIITTDVDGCREVVKDGVNGILVPPRNAAALATAIERLIGDAETRRGMGRRGREIVLKDFTDAAINRQTLAEYRRLVELREQHLS